MNTQNIQFHDEIRKFPSSIPLYSFSWAIVRISWWLENKFESSTVNELSVFESLRFYCSIAVVLSAGMKRVNCIHYVYYENMPIQIYRKFHLQKLKISDKKTSDIFHISAQNIDCGYSLEPPRRGGSNEYSRSIFLSRNKKNHIYPCKPLFYYINHIGMFSWWKI